MIKYLIILTSIILLFAITGPVIWSVYLNENRDFIVGVTAFSVGVITFFGVIGLNRSTEGQPALKDDSLRTAIACSIVISYLFIVSFTTFVENSVTMGPVTQEFIRSFSNVVGITIAFYFGASALARIFDKNRGDELESNPKKEKEEE